MSQGYSGVEGNVFANASDVDTMGWTADFEVNTWDSTTTADAGWDDTSTATKKLGGTFDILYNKARKPFGTLALLPGTRLTTLTLYIDKSDDEKMYGGALITKVSKKGTLKEGVVLTISFVNSGPWTIPT